MNRARQRRWWLALALVVTVLVVGAGAARFWTQLVQQSDDTFREFHRRVSAVQIETDNADVAVFGGAPGDQVTVRRDLRWTFRRPQVRESWSGGTLVVSAHCGANWPPLGPACRMALDLHIPARTPVTYLGKSGTLRAWGLNGPLQLTSRSGQLAVFGAGGTIDATVDSGTFSGVDLHSARTTASAVSGTLALNYASPPLSVSARTDSGTVALLVPRGTRYHVTGRTTSGSYEITPTSINDPASPFTLDTSALSGTVAIGYR